MLDRFYNGTRLGRAVYALRDRLAVRKLQRVYRRNPAAYAEDLPLFLSGAAGYCGADDE